MVKTNTETQAVRVEIKRLKAENLTFRKLAMKNYSLLLDAIEEAKKAIDIAERAIARKATPRK